MISKMIIDSFNPELVGSIFATGMLGITFITWLAIFATIIHLIGSAAKEK